MIRFRQKGDFSKTFSFLKKERDFTSILDRYGREGVRALSSDTPIDSGLTASSWYYKIIKDKMGFRITFNNSNIQNGVPIAVILQYGHGTGTGGWVEGIDYINPSLRPVFEKLANSAWEEVVR